MKTTSPMTYALPIKPACITPNTLVNTFKKTVIRVSEVIRSNFQRVMICFAAACLTACVSTPDILPSEAKPTLRVGRFTVSYQKDGEQQREQGGFEWKIQGKLNSDDLNNNTRMQLSLLSPLGTTLAVLAYDPDASLSQRASLVSASNIDTAPSMDALMQRTLGWTLPLNELLPWLGPIAPKTTPKDWVINVPTRYGSDLPRLITASNESLKVSVRLVFEE